MRYPLVRHLTLPAILTLGAAPLASSVGGAHAASSRAAMPVRVTVFAPRPGDVAGVAGKGFVVDLALDAAPGHSLDLVGSPRFIAPTDPLFKPGPNPAIPGLVVALSSNKKRTNLANLFQLTGVARVNGSKQIWTTWLVGKALFGAGVDSTLTVYLMKGLAPTVVPAMAPSGALLSNVTTVRFHINGPMGQTLGAQPTAWPTTGTGTTTATHVQAAIRTYAYSPKTLTVARGATVTWTNNDAGAHTVTSDTAAWAESDNIASGKSFSVTFTKPGTYPYHCGLHPFMTGTVVVR